MKTISISVLILVAGPMSLLTGQEISKTKTLISKNGRVASSKYYADQERWVKSTAGHLEGASEKSNRAAKRPRLPTTSELANGAANVASQVGSTIESKSNGQIKPTTFQEKSSMVNFSKLATSPLAPASAKALIENSEENQIFVKAAPLSEFSKPKKITLAAEPSKPASVSVEPPKRTSISGGDFSPKSVPARVASAPLSSFKPVELAPSRVTATFHRPKQTQEVLENGIEVVAPPAAQDIVDDIVRPTPENSQSEFLPPTLDSDSDFMPEATTDEAADFAPNDVQAVEPARDDFFSQSEPISLEELRASERIESWHQPQSGMRHVTDHFSPGGEPFAQRTHQFGNPNFFGVDRRTCCDEWANECNCSGGLKVNPGHLGIPWLRSKDSCDSPEPICKHCRSGRCGQAGCQTCSN